VRPPAAEACWRASTPQPEVNQPVGARVPVCSDVAHPFALNLTTLTGRNWLGRSVSDASAESSKLSYENALERAKFAVVKFGALRRSRGLLGVAQALSVRAALEHHALPDHPMWRGVEIRVDLNVAIAMHLRRAPGCADATGALVQARNAAKKRGRLFGVLVALDKHVLFEISQFASGTR